MPKRSSIRPVVSTQHRLVTSFADTRHFVDTRLRSVFNAAAHLVFSARKSEHISLLRELHFSLTLPLNSNQIKYDFNNG